MAFAVAAATVAVGLLWSGIGSGDRLHATAALNPAALPAAPAPALRIGRPDRLPSSRFLSRWTVVRTPAIARSRPSVGAPAIAEVGPSTPEGTANVVMVLRSRVSAGALWVEVRLPVLPNGTVGWLRRRALGAYETVDTRLVVDRPSLRATLYRNGIAILSAPVGIGTESSPTPPGEFTIRSELTRYASPFYGPIAFGTTARSAVLTDWPAGGFVGIHGTNEPELIPGHVSHGCIRMRNSDLLRLAALMPVGTPLTIR
jgi:hypothetical protein